MEATTIREPEKKQHILMEDSLESFKDLSEWRRAWEETKRVEIRQSLLHCGLEVPYRKDDDFAKQVIFYLDVADGYDDDICAKEEIRVLARKAFEVLLRNVFKMPDRPRYSLPEVPLWTRWMVMFPEVLEKFFWFFRSETAFGGIRLCNTKGTKEHHRFLIDSFLMNLVSFCWNQKLIDSAEELGVDEEKKKLLRSYRPQCVDILCCLGKLQGVFLNRGGYSSDRGWELDENSLSRLKELALSNERHNPHGSGFWNRQVASLEEAVYMGSPAAQTLVLYEIQKEVDERLKEAAELERTKKMAERRLKELASTNR